MLIGDFSLGSVVVIIIIIIIFSIEILKVKSYRDLKLRVMLTNALRVMVKEAFNAFIL